MDKILSSLYKYTDLATLLSYSLTCKTLYYWYSTATHVYAGYKFSRHYVNSAIKLSRTPNTVHLIGDLFESVYTLLYSLYNNPTRTALISMGDTSNNRIAQSILTKWDRFTIHKYTTVITQPATLLYYNRVVVLDFDRGVNPKDLIRTLHTLSLKVFYLSDRINIIAPDVTMVRLSNVYNRRIKVVNHKSITQYITTENIIEYAYNINSIVSSRNPYGIGILPLQYHVVNNISTGLVIVDIPDVLLCGNPCIVSYSNMYEVLSYVSLQHPVYVVVSDIINVNIDDIKRILFTQFCLSEYTELTIHVIDFRKILHK